MDRLDLVLAIIDASGGAVGRTELQKLGYFASLEAGLGGIRYKDHFYGPFSKEVAFGIEDTRAALLVNETVRSSPIESYAYSLTDDGREIVKHVRREFPEECAVVDRIVAVCRERRALSATGSHSPQSRTTCLHGRAARRIAPPQGSRGWQVALGGT